MRLPYAERAIVDIRKISEYCLSMDHPRGRHKARVFAKVLGMTAADAGELAACLRDAAWLREAVFGIADEYGERYVIDFPLERNGRRATIRSGWIVKRGERAPRFVTCYVL